MAIYKYTKSEKEIIQNLGFHLLPQVPFLEPEITLRSIEIDIAERGIEDRYTRALKTAITLIESGIKRESEDYENRLKMVLNE